MWWYIELIEKLSGEHVLKNLYLLFIMSFLNSNLFALEYNSKVVCTDGVCEKKEIFNGLQGADLKVGDIKVGQCLVDVAGRGTFYRVIDVDVLAKKIVTINEKEELPRVVILKRNIIFTDSKDFNPNMKIITCSSVNGSIINSDEKTSKCLSINGKYSFELYCEKDRVRNF